MKIINNTIDSIEFAGQRGEEKTRGKTIPPGEGLEIKHSEARINTY